MLIPVLIEPGYRGSIWARQTLDGLSQEAAKRKYRFQQLDGEAYTGIDYDALFGQEKRMVIIAGTSITWMPEALRFFSEREIGTVLISFDPQESVVLQGMVRMDYVNAMHTLLTYLSGCGRSSVACYGFNPNSSADAIKQRYFEMWNRALGHGECRNVFHNLGSLEACYAQFRAAADDFDAVICANDIVAVSLIKRLKADGISVPEQLYITSFGDSLLAQRISPTITAASLDHYEMGRQAVLLYAHLCRQKASTNMSVRVHSRLIIRESTALTPMAEKGAGRLLYGGNEVTDVDFYSDDEVMRLSLAEQMLNACDAVDEALIRGILHSDTYEKLEEALYLTADALKYRKKRLMNLVKCRTNAELREFLLFCEGLGLFE